MTTPTEKLAKFRELGSLRAKKHYDLNKTAINEKRRERYALKHGRTIPVVIEPVIEEENNETFEMDEPEPVEPVLTKAQKKKQATEKARATREAKEANRETFSLDTMIEKIKGLGIDRPATQKKYIDDVKRIMNSTKCKDFLKCLKNPKKLIKDIQNSKMANGKGPYKANSHKSSYQFILKMIDVLKLPVDKKLYDEQFNLFKIKSMSQNELKRQTEIVPTFEEYLDKSKEEFGEDSREYLLGKLYEEIPVRDDFGLHILKSEDKTKKLNYLLMRRGKPMEIIINHHKTSGKYGPVRHVLSKPLEAMMVKYLENKKIKEDGIDARKRKANHPTTKHSEFVFGTETLSSILNKMNKTLGYSDGANLFRHMAVSQLTADTPAEQKLALSKTMMHSPLVQMNYMRKHKIID